MHQRGHFWVRNAACAALLGGLALAVLLPVYGDEIGWRFQERAGIDGIDKLFSDLCGPNTLAAPPFFMMPVRWYSAYFNTAFVGPAWIRASGIAYALALVALLGLVVRRLDRPARERAQLLALGAGLLGLGALPLLMAWSRPEQPILLCATAAILLALADWRAPLRNTARGTAWLRSLTIALLATIALSYHLKALFLLPVFASAILLASRGTAAKWPRLTTGALLLAVTGWSALYWVQRLQCPGDPVLQAFFSAHNIGVELTGMISIGQVPGVIAKLLGNIRLLDYATLAAPAVEPMAGWLAPGQIGAGAQRGWRLALNLAWLGAMLVGLICFVGAVVHAMRERRLPPALLLSAAAAVSAVGWAGTEYQRNVYEAGFVLPLLALAIVLACAAPRASATGSRLAAAMAILTGLGAVASAGLMAASYGPSLVRALDTTGHVLPDQPHSVSLTHYGSARRDILGAARLCGIPEPARAQGLLVDDATYPALAEARLPQHQLGVLGLWRGTIRDPVAYLKSRKSDGMVVTCALLPPELRARARTQGQFCCLGPKTGW
jgi:hypothetical protein